MNTPDIVHNIRLAIAAAGKPYSGAALVCLPDGRQITQQEYWNSLTQEQQDLHTMQANAAFGVMGGIGLERVIEASFQCYIDEK